MYRAHIQEAKENFLAEGRPTKWPALSPRYKEWKERKYPGRPIMVMTGKTKRSMITGGPDHIKNIKPLSAVFGTKAPLAFIHQYKFEKRRPVIQYPDSIFREFDAIMSKYLRGF